MAESKFFQITFQHPFLFNEAKDFIHRLGRQFPIDAWGFSNGVGEHTEHEHSHYYIEFSDRHTVPGLYSWIHTREDTSAHVEIAEGNAEQNQDYLEKNAVQWANHTEDSEYSVLYFGEFKNHGQGNRSDLDRLGSQLLNKEINLRYIAQNHPGKFLQFGKRFRDLEATAFEPRKTKPYLIQYFNCNHPWEVQSKVIEDACDDDELRTLNYFWFDGKDWFNYRQQHVCFIDGEQTSYDDIRKINSTYQFFVGPDHMPFNSPVICVIWQDRAMLTGPEDSIFDLRAKTCHVKTFHKIQKPPKPLIK